MTCFVTARCKVTLIAHPSLERDRFEAVLQRWGADVQTFDCASKARQGLWLSGVRAIILNLHPGEAEIDELLTELRDQHPQIPILLSGSWDPYRILPLVGPRVVVMLPASRGAQALDEFLAATTGVAEQTVSHVAHGTDQVLLRRLEYSPKLRQARVEFEEEFLTRALERRHGNVSRTAQDIGMARRNLQTRINLHNLDVRQFRERARAGSGSYDTNV